MRFKTLLIVCLSIFLASCSTGYRPLNDSGGYWNERIESTSNKFKIGYDGNKWHSDPINRKERVIDLALLRSAEVALENGFKYFIITDSKAYTEKTDLLQGSIPSNTTASRLKRRNTSVTYQVKASFSTVNYVDVDKDSLTNNVMQTGEFKGYALYKADLVIYTVLKKYNMSNNALSPIIERYGSVSAPTSNQTIETIDMVPTNPK
ncbi:MAG: hypothetical protein CMD78_06305 [Gammaproteobacteria bacterium]|nr:hypothetical protein [Gammaproteobacteria bacterium]|tara:strand:- start:1313 stop:1930 length:618 start_codon:yes stop_codon:yes gene_type:complete